MIGNANRVGTGLWGGVAVLLWGAHVSAEPAPPLRPLPDPVTATVTVRPEVVERPVSPQLVGVNLHPHAKRLIDESNPKRRATIVRRVIAMGLATIRFPNGCVADRYNWKEPRSGWATVDEFLAFCDLVRAEPYYTLNMQGGTEGLARPIPDGAALEEVIKYQHPGPNPCGNTDYHFGTLAEALELVEHATVQRALAGEQPVLCYELGNESWGQAKGDWTPAVYGKTCEAYARAMREYLAQRRKELDEPAELGALKLWIVMQGFPITGNNMRPEQAVDRDVNVAWTAEVNRLARLGLIDAVQEHFYPYGDDGSTLIWDFHNLRNILLARQGIANPRLVNAEHPKGYVDPAIAYDSRLALEWTEWNTKCWGRSPRDVASLPNLGFEDGLEGWTVESSPADTGVARAMSHAARRGHAGLELETPAGCDWVEVRRRYGVGDWRPFEGIGAAAWVKSDTPDRVQLILRDVTEETDEAKEVTASNKAEAPKELKAITFTQTGMWERRLLAAHPQTEPETAEVELAIRLAGAGAAAWVDEVRPMEWEQFRGSASWATGRYAQTLANADMLRVLLEAPTTRTHYHHLFGNYGCPLLMQRDGAYRQASPAFRFFRHRLGEAVVRTTVEVPTFDYYSEATWCTDFNACVETTAEVPALAATTTRAGDRVFVMLVNRTTDRPIAARLVFPKWRLGGSAEVRTLHGEDIELPGGELREQKRKVTEPFVCSVPPLSAQMVTVRVTPADASGDGK
jgi:alpha-L-arabinofuranosidase